MLQEGLLLRIYLAESAKIHHQPGYRYLVDFFLHEGFSGCTVFRSMAGYGHEHFLRTVDVLTLSLDLPIVIDVVDSKERIMAILPEVEKMVDHGLVIVQEVKMIRKGSDKSR